ncbi:hypothetical protein BMS3Abin17_00040 [archaeon BMS3Abin17]|nr:hypothetical protein BMS3Abin17_00040 [archaeon BMS3Abin17]
MSKEEEKTGEKENEETKETKSVMLGEVPTEYGLVYQTPDGVLNEKEYLVWLGNMIVEIKQALKG